MYIASPSLSSEPQTHISTCLAATPLMCLMGISNFAYPKPNPINRPFASHLDLSIFLFFLF